MIYLLEGSDDEMVRKANEAFLYHFVCGAAGHPPATRLGFNATVCLCGAWYRPVTHPADDTVSMVTVNALREEVRIGKARMWLLRSALELAIATLQDHGEYEVSSELTEVLNGKVPA